MARLVGWLGILVVAVGMLVVLGFSLAGVWLYVDEVMVPEWTRGNYAPAVILGELGAILVGLVILGLATYLER